jgi:hypothetical protein
MNHALLPKVKDAQLPAKYEAARVAIAEASQVDECKDWADKAAALASYARQSQDEEMEKTAMRIRARAIRRCGELLKEIEKQQGKRSDVELKATEGPKSASRKEAAKEAGLSERESKTAIRVANVPTPKFEAQVESEKPPTITKLAEQGTAKRKPVYEEMGITKQAFQAGMYYAGSLRDLALETRKYDPQDVVDGCTKEEREEMRRHIEEIERFNDRIIAKL